MERRTHAVATRRSASALTTLWFLMVASAAVVLFASTDANATIIDNDWYTTDTSTNLDWADVSLTNHTNWNQMQNGAGHGVFALSGWLNEGWRHATHNEVLAFWSEITGFAFTNSVSHHTSNVQGMVGALVGNTRSGYGYYGAYHSTYGYIAENANSHYTYWMGLHHYRHYNNAYGVGFSHNISMNYQYQSGWGHWLVRSAPTGVPEPGTLALILFGVAGIAAARRNRQN